MLCVALGVFRTAPLRRFAPHRRRTAAMAAAAVGGPREQPAGLEAEAALFSEFAAVPSFQRGSLVGTGGALELLLSVGQRDLEANAQRSFMQTLRIDAAGPLLAPAFGFELRGAALAVPSPSGRRMLVVRNPSGTVNNVILELWGGGRVLREVEVPASVHGPAYADGWFEGVAWSSAEDHVAYVAEAPAAVRTPLWGGRAPPGSSDAATAGWRGQSEHVEDWGEQLTGKKCAALFVVDVPSGAVHAVRGLPADSSCGQVVWAPGDTALVFTAWPFAAKNFNTLRRLGAIYCLNRPCAIYTVAAPAGGETAPAVCLTPALASAFSPRFSPSGTSLALASNDAACASGAHNSATALHVLRWGPAGAEGEPRCALPVVDTPASAGAWPGWFTAGPLARAPWVSDTELVVCSTWGSGDALVLVDTSAGRVRRLSPPLDQAGQWQLLDVREGVVAAAASTPAEPPYVAVAAAPDWAWRRVQHATAEPFGAAVDAALTSLEWRIVDVPLPGRAAGVPAEVEAVLLRSAPAAGSARLPPVLLVPHGGPHSACVAGFSMPLAFLAAQGYAVLQVNYRASTGFGLAALESSLGRAGQQDVQDCLTALDAAIAAQLVDGTRVAVIGGSHGGFLAAHLIGQAPERFACAALRNPVTDVATMVGVSDIPDWCFVETAGLGISAYTEVPTAELLAAMRSISPIAHIEAVRAPVLMLLGAKDRRVPPSNGMAYAHALRQYGKAVRVLVFPEDEHPLSKPRTELESYINIVDWLRTFMPPRA